MKEKEINMSVGLGRHREILEKIEWTKRKPGFQGLSRSKREPSAKLSDGTCMALGRRGIFLGKDTQDIAQLLSYREKKNYNEGEQKKNLYSYLTSKKSLQELEFNYMPGTIIRNTVLIITDSSYSTCSLRDTGYEPT